MNLSWNKHGELPTRVGHRKILRRFFELPDGRLDEFDIKQEGPAVCVLALTKKNEVILVEQYRPGPERILLELPGGGVESGETPENAIQRELLEETGYAGLIELVGTSLDCAYSTMTRYNFVATNCLQISDPKPDANEFLRVSRVSVDQFREHLRGGQLTDVETGYLGLDALGLL